MEKMKVEEFLKICTNKDELIYIYDNDMKPVYASDIEEFFERKGSNSDSERTEFVLNATVETFKIEKWDLIIVANERFNGEI